ncbi:hypothetical protein B9G55_19325 [Saccharibacillus sp. O16]|nr:hypothetical protein B9G55_19325 [Saccharibacillus sp. O16]
MQDWSTDFIQSDTTYMVLKSLRQPAVTLNRVQIRMLAASSVPHVLDLHVREVDAEAQLHYNIGGKKMLSSSLKTERLTLVEYYALLLQITTALEYGMTYMLSPNGFILQEDYMFMDGPLSAGTVYLTYLPLQDMLETGTVRERLGRLAARWMTTIENLQGSGVQRILQMCEQQTFSLQSLKELLVRLLAESGRKGAAASEAPAAASNGAWRGREEAGFDYESLAQERPRSNRSAGSMGQRGRMDEPQRSSGASAAWGSGDEAEKASRPAWQDEEEADSGRSKWLKKASSPAGGRSEGSHKADKKRAKNQPLPSDEAELDESEEGLEPESKNGRLVVPLISLLGLVILWRFLYLDQPSRMSLLICVVLTPLLLVAAYLGWSGKLKFGRLKAERIQEAEEAEALATAWGSEREALNRRTLYEEMEAGMDKHTGMSRLAASAREPEAFGEPDAGHPVVPHFLRPAYGGSGANERSYERADLANRGYGAAERSEETSDRSSAAMGTGTLSSGGSQPTVILDDGRSGGAAGGSQGAASLTRYRLERVEKGTMSTHIPLPHGSFTIGRSDEVAQHVEELPGISRAHVEIELSNEHCLIRDIGSRNGTVLNEESMIPYKAYELHEGDTFKIAGIAYTMRCG